MSPKRRIAHNIKMSDFANTKTAPEQMLRVLKVYELIATILLHKIAKKNS